MADERYDPTQPATLRYLERAELAELRSALADVRAMLEGHHICDGFHPCRRIAARLDSGEEG